MTRNTESGTVIATWMCQSVLPELHALIRNVKNRNTTSSPRFEFTTPMRIYVVALAYLPVLMGCSPNIEPPGLTATQSSNAEHKATEFWDVHYLNGAKIGYTVTRLRHDGRKSGPDPSGWPHEIVRIESTMIQQIRRFGDETKTELRHESIETPTGEILRCGWSLSGGSGTMASTFALQNGVLSGQVRSGDDGANDTQNAIQLEQTNWGGYFAVEQSLRKNPMAAGERRVVPGLLPFYNVVSRTVLEAAEKPVMTALLCRAMELVPVKCTLHIGDTHEVHTLWVDPTGEILKSELEVVNQVSYRTDRATALRAGESDFDLGLRTSVAATGLSGNPHLWNVARYRITASADIDLAELFPGDRKQSVSQSGDHALEVIVDSHCDALPVKLDADIKQRFLAASAWIQTTDPRITSLAATIPAASPDQVAAAAAALVREHVEFRNYSHAMATAAAVAESRAGDCSEHALLLAAICRARGIPTRVAIGLVFVPHNRSFAYHMWNEAFIDGRWSTLDATLEKTGSGHLKMADTTFADTASLAILNRVLTAMGSIEIELLDLQDPHR